MRSSAGNEAGMQEYQSAQPTPGQTVLGRFIVDGRLGQGSTGMVYAVRDIANKYKPMALKVLTAKAASRRELVDLFRNEIYTSYRISHPNVVRCYEFFRSSDTLAFTMELVTGGDLLSFLQKRNPVDLRTTLKIFPQLMTGLQAIHDAGIIHQDIKPGNVLLSEDGTCKITDFTAAALAREEIHSTKVMGTLSFLAPETLSEGVVDKRSDIYALGCVMYYTITGQLPFEAENVYELTKLKLRGKCVAPHKLRSDCPYELSQFVMLAIERRSEFRYQDCIEMLDTFAALDLSSSPTLLQRILWEGPRGALSLLR